MIVFGIVRCMLVLMRKLPFSERMDRAKSPLERIHMNIMGPITPESLQGGCRYIVTFVDDCSRFVRIYCLQQRSEAGNSFRTFPKNSRYLLEKDEKVYFVQAKKRERKLCKEKASYKKRKRSTLITPR